MNYRSNFIGKFPRTRLRRNRRTSWYRDLISETELSVKDLIQPLFLTEGKNIQENIKSMPTIKRYSVDQALKKINDINDLKIPAIALFPNIENNLKSATGKEALNKNNLICRAIKKIKKEFPSIGIISDIALDPYTSHGHDGILKKNIILNDETIDILTDQAIIQAEAGADILAPSDMMDGRIGMIRDRLDNSGFKHISILSYAVKYASNFYSPFREAVGSIKTLKGDKKTYQMDYRNSNEAIREVATDIEEGADMIMVKPALPYLDIINKIKSNFKIPIIGYQVSGEFSMLKLSGDKKILDYDKCLYETLISIKRSGASAIVTYGATDIAKKLK